VVACCMKVLRAIAASLLACAAAPAALGQDAHRSASPQVILLDGSIVPFRSLQIENELLRGDDLPPNLTLDDLRRIELPAEREFEQQKPKAVVTLRFGGQVRATSISIADDKCHIEWSAGRPLSVPVDFVRAVRFNLTPSSAEFQKALAAHSAELDRVFVTDDQGQTSSVTGSIDVLDSDRLTLNVNEKEQRVPASKLYGFVVAQPATTESPPKCLVTFRDGSTLGGDVLTVANSQASLSLPGSGKAEFAWSAVVRVSVRSIRVAFLSDVKPIAEEQQPLLTLPQPAQRDKSVSGGPLTLDKQTFEKGLGVHARSSLTFAADKRWDKFAVTIGLDAAAGGKGDCVFVVIADGQRLLARPMKGTDPPAEIELAITGRESVTLLVEPGEGLDLADHADWCDARFIKARK
jgi:NPCBM/NEW2 domain